MSVFKKSRVIFYQEGPEWVEKIRRYISTKLLDIAERLPAVKAGYLYHLQFIRENQRRSMEEQFKEHKFPDQIDMDFYGFQLMDMVHVEDFQQLRNSLKNVFPNSSLNRGRDFDHFPENLTYGGWQRQGCLLPEGSKKFSGFESAYVKNLPTEIEAIEVSTLQVTHSLMAIIYQVRIKEESRKKYISFFRKRYMYPTKIGWYRRKFDFLPFDSYQYLFSGVEHHFRIWSERLQKEVESVIRNYLSGYIFFKDRSRNSLPRVDIFIYSIKKVGDDEIKEQPNRIPNWRMDLGFHSSSRFIDKESGWEWIQSTERVGREWPTRIIVDEDDFTENEDFSAYSTKRNYAWVMLMDWLRGICIPYSIDKYFEFEKKKIVEVRRQVFQPKTIRLRTRIGKLLKLLMEVESSFIELDRVIMEFEIEEKYIERLTEKGKNLVYEFRDEWTLKDEFQSQLESNKHVLNKHREFLSAALNQIVGIVTLRNSRKVTWFTILISVISLIVAIIALNPGWNPFLGGNNVQP